MLRICLKITGEGLFGLLLHVGWEFRPDSPEMDFWHASAYGRRNPAEMLPKLVEVGPSLASII